MDVSITIELLLKMYLFDDRINNFFGYCSLLIHGKYNLRINIEVSILEIGKKLYDCHN